ncbi:MAG: PLDc N-terminal domain-containing protein [Actinomycetes bacterium]
MLRVLVYAIPLILAVYALVDCIQTEDSAVRGLPKMAWVVLIVVLWVVGPIAWLVAGRDRSRARPGIAWPSGPGGIAGQQRQPRRVVAPDDDPDFLRQLGRDRDRRRREDEARCDKPGEPDTTDEGDSDSSRS